MLDIQKLTEQYALGYADKSRVYFTKAFFSTFNASVGKETPFNVFPRQEVFMHSLAENKNTIAIKHRQCGITTVTSAFIAAECVYADEDSPITALCIGNKLDLSQQLIEKIRTFLLQVPRIFWGEDFFSEDPKSEKNKKSIFVKDSKVELLLFNGCHIHARSSGPNAARGISAVSHLVFDEAAFIEDGLSVYSSAVAATSSCPNAKIIMISTPNGRDELYYDTYRQAKAHENNYNAVEFKWFQDLRYNKNLSWRRKNEETGADEEIIEQTLDDTGTIRYDEEKWKRLEQEGWKPTSPWYEGMKQSFNNDARKIAQELDVSFEGSANNVVAPEFITMQETYNVREPLDNYNDPMVEETWFWKEPIEGHRYILSADPSRGDGADYTAIEIIDMDGRDANGLPIIEQVAEYHGKKFGDEIGQIIYNYANLYNGAFVIVDATGSVGDATLLTLINLGYKNMYYEDNSQKTYTIQNLTKDRMSQFNDRLPGFHFQGNRFAVLSCFAGMVRNNEFKIRSARVINELNTWIFQEKSGKMDHQSGSHDDLICALSMAMFVMQYSLNKLQNMKAKDSAILRSYMTSGGIQVKKENNSNSIAPQNGLPFYSTKTLQNKYKANNGCMWLFAGLK